MKFVLILLALALFPVTGRTQPPTAPPPRKIEPEIRNLTFTYTGPEATKTPLLEMAVKDGKVEVRWKLEGKSCTVIATRVVVRDGMMSFVGTEKEPVVLTQDTLTIQALRIDVSLGAGTFKAFGAGTLSGTFDPKK